MKHVNLWNVTEIIRLFWRYSIPLPVAKLSLNNLTKKKICGDKCQNHFDMSYAIHFYFVGKQLLKDKLARGTGLLRIVVITPTCKLASKYTFNLQTSRKRYTMTKLSPCKWRLQPDRRIQIPTTPYDCYIYTNWSRKATQTGPNCTIWLLYVYRLIPESNTNRSLPCHLIAVLIPVDPGRRHK